MTRKVLIALSVMAFMGSLLMPTVSEAVALKPQPDYPAQEGGGEPPPPPVCTLQGTVVNPEYVPIPAVSVTVSENIAGGDGITLYTNGDGFYQFSSLPAELTYDILFRKGGYIPQLYTLWLPPIPEYTLDVMLIPGPG